MLRAIFFCLLFYPWTLFSLLVALGVAPFGQNRVHSWGIFWGRTCLRLAGLKFTVSGTEHLPHHEPAIYVCNHQSNFDILLLYAGLPIQFRWMAKKELFRIPLFGAAMKCAGYIPIDRSNRREAMRSLTAAAQRIKDGASVVIFPEGTRTTDGKLQPFKKGALLIATKAGVPVVPMAISGSYQAQPKGQFRISPAHLKLTILPAIPPSRLGASQVDELTRQLFDRIDHCLNNESRP